MNTNETAVKKADMNWQKWYIENQNPAVPTIYWAATGKRPGYSEVIAKTFHKHQKAIINNVIEHNKLLGRLR